MEIRRWKTMETSPIIGNDTPRYNFGFGFNADWNGIDFSMFLQGTMKRDLWLEGPVAFGLGGGQWGSNCMEKHTGLLA